MEPITRGVTRLAERDEIPALDHSLSWALSQALVLPSGAGGVGSGVGFRRFHGLLLVHDSSGCAASAKCATRRRVTEWNERSNGGRSQRVAEAGGSLALEAQGAGGSRPDNDGGGPALPDGPGPASDTGRCTTARLSWARWVIGLFQRSPRAGPPPSGASSRSLEVLGVRGQACGSLRRLARLTSTERPLPSLARHRSGPSTCSTTRVPLGSTRRVHRRARADRSGTAHRPATRV
jgi:hypothetical protein